MVLYLLRCLIFHVSPFFFCVYCLVCQGVISGNKPHEVCSLLMICF
nr:MAG TPA: C2H2 type zinc-finger protein [Caudoviricetes sp.]